MLKFNRDALFYQNIIEFYKIDEVIDMDDLVYVKFINENIGFGVFAKKDL